MLRGRGLSTASTALAVTGPGHLLPPSDRHTPHAHLFRPPSEQSLDAALADTRTLLDRHGHLVVVHPTTLPTPHLHRLHAIRSLLESDRIALLPSSLPPLGIAVLVRQLRQLSACDFSPGVLGAAGRLLGHYIHAGALVNSVARLDRLEHVRVPFAAHARSWLPGVQFAVLAAPVAQVVRLGGGGTGGGTSGGTGGETEGVREEADAAEAEVALHGPRFATRLTVARRRLVSDWVTGTLARRWQAGPAVEVELPADSPAWWGTGKLVEFAAGIPDVSVLYRLVASVRRDECHWCGLELIGDRCAFCAAPVPSGAARGPSRPAAPPGARPPYGHPPGAAGSLRTAVVADPRGL